MDQRIICGDIELDMTKRTVVRAGTPVALTTAQLDILAFLMRQPGRVCARSEILAATAGTEYGAYERTLDAHIKNIRKALHDDPAASRYIGTVRGVGYKFIEPPA